LGELFLLPPPTKLVGIRDQQCLFVCAQDINVIRFEENHVEEWTFVQGRSDYCKTRNFGGLVYYIILAHFILAFLLVELSNTPKIA